MEQRIVNSRIENVVDLSPQQEGLVYHALTASDTRPYIVQQVFIAQDRNGDALAIGAVEAAVAALARRHSILRTSIVAHGMTRPRQVVLADREPEFAVVDLREAPADDVVLRLDRLLTDDIARGFRLDRDPLLRVTAVQTRTESGEQLRLVWTYHHVIMDGWSLARLFDDFRVYSDLAQTAGREEVVRRAERDAVGTNHYSDYVAWTASRDDAAFDRYWSDLMREVAAPARLTSAEREPRRDGAGEARYAITTGAGLAAALTARYAARGVTLAHIVEAALAVVLARTTGSTDVVFGKVVSGRDVDVDGLDDVVGLFVNSVPVRVRIDPADTIDSLLEDVRVQALATAAHSHGRLSRIHALADQRELFECLLAVENFSLADEDLIDAGLRFEKAREETNYPLTVTVQPVGDELRFIVMVDSARLTIADAEIIVDRLVRVLTEFSSHDEATIAAIGSVGEEERAQVAGFEVTSHQVPRASSIGEAFATAVESHADRTAIVDRGREVSYEELAGMSERLSAAMRAAGVASGDRVGVLGSPTASLVASMLGASLAGAAYVPLDVTAPPERQSSIISDAGIRVVVCADGSAALLIEEWADHQREGIIVLDAAVVSASGARPTAARPTEPRGSESLAAVMYTSGTTGRPKGVMIPHRAVLRLVLDNASLPLRASDTLLLTGSIAFDASTFEIFGMLLNGGTLVLEDRDAIVDTASLGALVTRHGVNVMWLTVSLFNHIATTDPWALDGIECLVIGGEAVTAEHVQRLYRENPRIEVLNGYGPTENTTFTTVHRFPRDFTRVVIGTPIGNTRVRIVRDGDHACGIGEIGEVVAGGDGVAYGYLGSPELTAQSFVRAVDGLEYRTGDRARWLSDGTVEYLGRVGEDRQVKVRGYRVELAEVEAGLLGLDGIEDVVVAARRDESGITRLHAYIVTSEPDLAGIRERAADALPAYMVPARTIKIAAMPLNQNGKLDTGALERLDADHPSETVGGEAPATPAEQAVADAFAVVLSLTDVRRNDSFFELGGDSIIAIRAVSVLRKAGLRCSVSRIMQSMTVDEIARHVEVSSRDKAPDQHVEGPVGRLPMVDRFRNWNLSDPAHFNQDVVIDLGSCTTAHVRLALDAVWTHHHALRAVVDGESLSIRRPDQASYEFTELHVGADGDVTDAIAGLAERLQPGFNLRTGPLVRAGLVHAPSGAKLLLIAHHLVVDIVSWHIIVEDVVAAVRAARAHQEIALPQPTASLREWSESLATAVRELPAADRAVWDEVDHALAAEQRQEGEPRARAAADPAPLLLDAETTALLKRVSVAFGATIEDLLLAGIGLAMEAVDGRRSIVVQREGHGRPEHALLPDASRTVGWFTSIHPVIVECEPESLHRSIVNAKEAVRRVPLGGVGYGLREGGDVSATRPSVSVNYIGDQGGAAAGSAFGAYRLHSAGNASAPGNRIPVGVQIDAFVADGRLRVFASVGADADAAAVSAFEGLGPQLAALAKAGARGVARVRTPSDFTRATDLRVAEQETIERVYDRVDDIIDLSPLQQGMLVQHLRSPQSRAYVVQQAFELEESLRRRATVPGGEDDLPLIDRVTDAFATLASRHPVLRTRFVVDDLRRPRQVVLAPGAASGPAVRSARVRGEAEFDALLDGEVERGFVLAEDRLMRVTVLEDESRAGGAVTLVLTYHHIILDGWSLARILDELVALLRGDELPEIATSEQSVFGEVIAEAARRRVDRSDDYWLEVLDGYDKTPKLHTALAFTEALAATSLAARSRRTSRAGLAARLAGRFHARGTTLAHLVQAALALTLGRAFDTDDVVIGKVVSGREAAIAGLDNATGLFINTIPARIRWNPQQSVRDLLDEVRDQAVASMSFEHVSLARIQNLVRHDQLVSCLYTFENYGLDADALGAAGLAFVRGREQTDYPLTLTAQRSGDELVLVWLYDAAEFGASDIERLSDRIIDVLEAFGDDDALTVAQASATPERLLSGLPQDTSAALASQLPAGLGEAFATVADRLPNEIAIADDEESLTYRELWARASAVAADLRQAGVRPGDRVGIAGETSIGTTVALVGVVLMGGSYVPVDVNAPAVRAQLILDDAVVAAVVAIGAFGHRFITEARLVAPVIHLEPGRTAEPIEPVVRAGDDEVYVMYTSGTTGRPKGVVIPQRAVLRVAWDNPDIPITGEDVVLAGSSVAFDAATLELWAPLLHGGRAVIAGRETLIDASALHDLFARHGVTVMFVTTSLFNTLVSQDPSVLGSLRAVMTGGEKADTDRMRSLYEASDELQMFHVYGPTENTTFTTAYPIPRTLFPGRTIPIGGPIAGSGVVVLDRNGLPCGPGEQGELTATGLGLAHGYVGMPDLTADRFPTLDRGAERAYRTGDRVQWLVDGTLIFLGRVTERAQVKIRGFRVEIGDIEAAIAQIDGVTDAVVVARSATGAVTVLAGYFVAAAPVTATMVREHLRDLVPDYMIPRHIVPLAAIPLNLNGKLDARALPWPEGEVDDPHLSAPASLAFAALSDDVERRVAEVWSQVLGIRDVSATDSFFELGGDSLTIAQVKSRLDAIFPDAVTIGDLFSYPDLRSLAARIRTSTHSRLAVDRMAVADLDGVEELSGRIVVGATWHDSERARAVYAFMLAVKLTATIPPRAILVHEADGVRSVPLPESTDHLANVEQIDRDLAAAALITNLRPVRLEGDGQVICVRFDSTSTRAVSAVHDSVDVSVVLGVAGPTLTLFVERSEPRADLRQATLVAARFATLLEGLLTSPAG